MLTITLQPQRSLYHLSTRLIGCRRPPTAAGSFPSPVEADYPNNSQQRLGKKVRRGTLVKPKPPASHAPAVGSQE